MSLDDLGGVVEERVSQRRPVDDGVVVPCHSFPADDIERSVFADAGGESWNTHGSWETGKRLHLTCFASHSR